MAHRGAAVGDLLVTVEVAVPPELDHEAAEALRAYARAEETSGFDPRADGPEKDNAEKRGRRDRLGQSGRSRSSGWGTTKSWSP